MVAAFPLLLVTTQELCLGFRGHSSGSPTPKERAGLFVYITHAGFVQTTCNHRPRVMTCQPSSWLQKAETRMSTSSSLIEKVILGKECSIIHIFLIKW